MDYRISRTTIQTISSSSQKNFCSAEQLAFQKKKILPVLLPDIYVLYSNLAEINIVLHTSELHKIMYYLGIWLMYSNNPSLSGHNSCIKHNIPSITTTRVNMDPIRGKKPVHEIEEVACSTGKRSFKVVLREIQQGRECQEGCLLLWSISTFSSWMDWSNKKESGSLKDNTTYHEKSNSRHYDLDPNNLSSILQTLPIYHNRSVHKLSSFD